METKPRGIHANFTTTCITCRREMTITNGRPDEHHCHFDITLDGIQFPETPDRKGVS